MMDFLKPVMIDLFELGLEKENIQIIVDKLCKDIKYYHYYGNGKKCERIISKNIKLISKYELKNLDYLNNNINNHDNKIKCFKKLILSSNLNRKYILFNENNDDNKKNKIIHNNNHNVFYKLWRDHVHKKFLKNNKNKKYKKLQITIIKKNELKHSFLNHDEILTFLKKNYPNFNILNFNNNNNYNYLINDIEQTNIIEDIFNIYNTGKILI
jgi:hypothetical protein